MKIHRSKAILAAFVFGLLLATLNSPLSTAFAQGTVFTYQGRLNDNGSPANGTNYTMVFYLYDAPTDGTLLGDEGIVSVTVSNGLFTVPLDFSNVFDGNPRWLEISVEKTGSGGDSGFTFLSPRQQITPTPYAIFANTASNVSSVISLVQLPSVLLTNGADISGTFTGNGAGLTNVPGTLFWQIVSGTNQQAAANTGYLATNDAQVIITLPSSPNLGDVIGISGSGAGGWEIAQNSGQIIKTSDGFSGYTVWTNYLTKSPTPYSVASSADGTMLVAGTANQIFTSTDAGMTWGLRTNVYGDYYAASSADGTKLFAIGQNNGTLYSSNAGMTWILQSTPPYYGTAIACSADGTKVVVLDGGLYFSPDSGVDWISRNSPGFSAIAMSADGTKFVAGSGSELYTSTNSGVSWTLRTNLNVSPIYAVASSADGTKLVAAPQNGFIYTSADSGATWTRQSSGIQNWSAIASSPDGTKLIAGTGRNGSPSPLYTSTDSGVTWLAQNSGSNYWSSVAISADGIRLFAVAQSGRNQPGVYISQAVSLTKTTPGTAGYLVGGQNAAVELQYVGSGQFILLNHEGTLFGF